VDFQEEDLVEAVEEAGNPIVNITT